MAELGVSAPRSVTRDARAVYYPLNHFFFCPKSSRLAEGQTPCEMARFIGRMAGRLAGTRKALCPGIGTLAASVGVGCVALQLNFGTHALTQSRTEPKKLDTTTMFVADVHQVKPDTFAWEGGSEQLVTWTFKGAVPEVDIGLFPCCPDVEIGATPRRARIVAMTKLLAWGVKNTGSHIVTVPAGLVPGNYFLNTYSASDHRISASSPAFTIDKSATPPEINDVALGRPPLLPVR